jgi:transcriptional regulator with XRE-family HTH domain
MSLNIELNSASPEQIEADLGRRLEALRLSRNINQAQLAAEAGVSRRTITRLENGQGVALDTLIRVLRALGMVDRLAALLPDPGVQPIERVRRKGKVRQRARPTGPRSTTQWSWGEPSDRS